MIRVLVMEETPNGVRPRPLDDSEPDAIELARQLNGREIPLAEVLTTIRNVAAMYGKYANISVERK